MSSQGVVSSNKASKNPDCVLLEPSLAKCLRFPFWSPIKEMLCFQSLPLHYSRSPQNRSPPFRFPSKNLYKVRDASFPKPSLTCLNIALRVPIKGALPSSSPHRASIERERDRRSNSTVLHLSLKVPGKTIPHSRFPSGGLYGERCPFPEPSLTFLLDSPINKLS